LLMKLNSSTLVPIWTKSTTRPNLKESFHDAVELKNGYFVTTGVYEDQPMFEDIFLAKVNPYGESCCMTNYPMNLTTSFGFNDKFRSVPLIWNYLSYGFAWPWHVQIPICPKEIPLRELPQFSSDESNASISVFPNPSTGTFTIKFINNDAGIAEIYVTDLTGRLLKQKTATYQNKEMVFDARNLSNGIYMLRVDYNGKSETLKLNIYK